MLHSLVDSAPTKLSDGTFAHYDVSANGNLITDKIIPIHGDWQAITLSQGGNKC